MCIIFVSEIGDHLCHRSKEATYRSYEVRIFNILFFSK